MSTELMEPEVDTEAHTLPPHNVVLANDEHHSMEFVVEVLSKVFRYEAEKCVRLMVEAHDTGRAIVWSGSKEVAELKAEQVQSCHEQRGNKDLGPLEVWVEAAE